MADEQQQSQEQMVRFLYDRRWFWLIFVQNPAHQDWVITQDGDDDKDTMFMTPDEGQNTSSQEPKVI